MSDIYVVQYKKKGCLLFDSEIGCEGKNDYGVSLVTLRINIHLSIEWISEKAMAPHSSTLAWKIPWTEEPGRLQSMGSLRVRLDWVTSLSLFTFMHWRRKWQPTPVFWPGESQGRWAAVYGVAQSQTWLKRLSSSSSIEWIYLERGESIISPLI